MRLLDVTPLIRELHRLFIAKTTSSKDHVTTLSNELAVAPVAISGGMGEVTLFGRTYTITPDTVCCVGTADGGLVTDFTVPMRGVLMSLIAPVMGQRVGRSPRVIAEYLQSMTLRFFQGGSVGGAIYDTKKWIISPHWVPIELPDPFAVIAGSIEDPVVRTINSLGLSNQDAEDARKAAQCAVDPFFTLLAIGGTTTIAYVKVPDLDDAVLKRWKPQLHHAGGDITDVTSRASTFVPVTTGEAWMTDAYDAMLKSGPVMTLLQAPRIFCIPGALKRLVWDEVAQCHWFRTAERDFRVDGLDRADVEFAESNSFALKSAWLDMLRGIRPSANATMTAFQASPIGYAGAAAKINPAKSGAIREVLTVSEEVKAYLRSDPQAPTSISWVLDLASGTRISRAWFLTTEEGYFFTLRGLNV